MPRFRHPAPIVLALLLTVAACAGEAPEPTVQRVENPTLGIVIAALPDGFTVEQNDATGLRLGRAGDEVGSVNFEVGPVPAAGVNLVEAVKAHKAEIEQRPNGRYQGQIELAAPSGAAYVSRGRWDEAGAAMEETAMLAVHPFLDRPLTLRYTYPAGDRADVEARRDHLMTLLGEIEAAQQAIPAG